MTCHTNDLFGRIILSTVSFCSFSIVYVIATVSPQSEELSVVSPVYRLERKMSIWRLCQADYRGTGRGRLCRDTMVDFLPWSRLTVEDPRPEHRAEQLCWASTPITQASAERGEGERVNTDILLLFLILLLSPALIRVEVSDLKGEKEGGFTIRREEDEGEGKALNQNDHSQVWKWILCIWSEEIFLLCFELDVFTSVRWLFC